MTYFLRFGVPIIETHILKNLVLNVTAEYHVSLSRVYFLLIGLHI